MATALHIKSFVVAL